jgi:hypothetical protein
MKFCAFHPKEKSWSAKWIVNHTSFDIAEYDGYYVQNTPQIAYQWNGIKISTWVPLIYLDKGDQQFLKFGNAVAEGSYQKEVTDWVLSLGVQWEAPTGNSNVADVHQEFLWFTRMQWTKNRWILGATQGLRWNPFEEDNQESERHNASRPITLYHGTIPNGDDEGTPSLVNLHSSFEYLQSIILSWKFDYLQLGWKNSFVQELTKSKPSFARTGLKIKKELNYNFDIVLEFSTPILDNKRKLLDLEMVISTSW